MKGERRHELEKNELADWLVETGEKIKPYQNVILGAVLGVVVLVGAISWWAKSSSAGEQAAWDRFHQAVWTLTHNDTNAAEFEDIVELFPKSTAAPWASVTAADLHLATGCNEVFIDKAVANQELQEAIDLYREVLDDPRGAVVHERAAFGLARANEAQGELKEAIKQYETVVRDWPDGTYAEAATYRLDELKRSEIGKFYDRIAKFEPKSSLAPETTLPGEMPAFDIDSLPGEGPIFDPPLLDLDGVSDEPAEPDANVDLTPEPLLPLEPAFEAGEADGAEPGATGAPDEVVEPVTSPSGANDADVDTDPPADLPTP